MEKRILSALIGLAGAINNNGKTEDTDAVVKLALLSKDSDEVVEAIHNEKFIISPGCATCQFPCGNTTDYPIEKLEMESSLSEIKNKIFDRLVRMAKKELINDLTYKAISYLGYELSMETYSDLLKEMDECLGK